MATIKTLYKAATGYYELQNGGFIKLGSTIQREIDKYFALEKSKSADEDTKAVQNGTYDPKEGVR